MYVSASNNPLSTLTLVHTWYEESTPQDTKRSSHPSNNKTRLPYKHVVDRFISNDPEYTNLGTLKLITGVKSINHDIPRASYNFKAFMLAEHIGCITIFDNLRLSLLSN